MDSLNNVKFHGSFKKPKDDSEASGNILDEVKEMVVNTNWQLVQKLEYVLSSESYVQVEETKKNDFSIYDCIDEIGLKSNFTC